jgi:hypothetical protein
MAKRLTELSVFISCPSNLADLRGVAEAAVQEVSNTLRVTANKSLASISWKEDIVPGVAEDGQGVINQQTLRKYDIYLGMIGSRFGTPTPRAGSGTEEEFDLALDQFRSDSSSIRILFYLQAFGVNPFDLNPTELQKVVDFRTKLQEQGVLYKELESLDDALSSVKSHLLKLISSEWDEARECWKDAGTTQNTARIPAPAKSVVKAAEHLPVVSLDHADTELGLLDLQVIGVQEFGLAGASIVKLGANLDSLTEKTKAKFDDFHVDPSQGPAGILQVIDAYAADIDEFVSDSRGELANARFHLSKGADHIEALYEQIQQLGIKPAESPAELIATVDGIEPSLRMFRSAVLAGKQTVEKLPPMTRRFKISQRALVALFDQIALELTLFLERLSLLKARVGDHH